MSYVTIFGKKAFFSIIKLVFRGKRDFSILTWVFYYNAILKDCVLVKQIQSSIEIDVIVVFKFSWKVCYIKVKKGKLIS